ncbi:MAG: lysylphosphatidylglycerol synthase transmembrane domain-containing protein [candidate division WOR-3 bacterium]
MSRRLLSVLQIIITCCLLYYLVRKVDLRASLAIIKQVNFFLLVLSAVIFVFFLLVGAWRWKILLDARKINFSMMYLTKVYFISWFFNNILPTSIGGDVVRIAYTVQSDNSSGKKTTSPAFAAVFVDRFIGFIGLFFFALLAATVLFLTQKSQKQYLLLNFLGFVILMTILLAVFSDNVHRIFSKIFSKIKAFRLGEKFDRAYTEVKEYREVKLKLIVSFLLSLLVQLLSSFIWYFVGISISVKISLLYYCLFIPIIGILTMIPITVGGLGMRENMFVNIFNSVANVSKEKATAISGLYLIINLLFALIGGVMFLFVKKLKNNP